MVPSLRFAAGVALTQVLTAAVGYGAILAQTTAVTASAEVVAMSAPVYQRVNPGNQASVATPWLDEARLAGSLYGYTQDLGVTFKASTLATPGLSPVRRLYNATTVDFAWALQGSAPLTSLVKAGYAEVNTNFYAAAGAVGAETTPVNCYVKNGKRRLAAAVNSASLTNGGWAFEYTAFHVPVGSVPGATTTPTTTPPPPPPPPPPSPTTTGAAAPGSTAYPIPASGVVYVAPWGNDSAAGSVDAPVRTVTTAVNRAPAGGTVVLRAGTYNESVTVAKAVTIQAYPNEAVWLDGSQPVTGWVPDGAAWRRDGWTVRFDHSPTYVQGAPDSTQPYWQFLNSGYPMAAHPDQVFVDGVGLRQVSSRSQVTSGTFYLDESTSKLYIGTNPSNRSVAASNQIRSLWVRSPDVRVRGLGMRRYSPSVFHMGAITVEQPRFTLENVVIEDAATTALSILNSDAKVTSVTLRRSGMLGMQARYADRVQINNLLSTQNNAEHFNIAPVSGGLKAVQTRGLRVTNSSFVGNYGHGFWQDMSTYDSLFTNNRFDDNVGTGLFLEISAKAVVVDNTFLRNGEFGIKVNNTADVKIWNNTFVGNGRALNLVQDNRRNTNRNDPAVDPRISWPDPAMPWTLGPVTVRNNVVAETRSSGNCLLCVEDYSYQMSAETMRISANGDVYHRASTSSPTWLAVWSRGTVSPYVFTTLAAFSATTGQERAGREYVGASIVTQQGALVPAVAGVEASIAQPLPADLAGLVGVPAGTTHLGAWL